MFADIIGRLMPKGRRLLHSHTSAPVRTRNAAPRCAFAEVKGPTCPFAHGEHELRGGAPEAWWGHRGGGWWLAIPTGDLEEVHTKRTTRHKTRKYGW